MIEGEWRPPLPGLTFARAMDAADVLRSYFEGQTVEALDEVIRLAKSCSLADLADTFCEGIQAILHLPKVDRPAAVNQLLDDCRFVAAHG